MQSFGRQLNMTPDVPGPAVLNTGTPQPEEPESNGPETFGRPISVTPFTPEPGASEQSTGSEKSFGRPLNIPGFSPPLAEESAQKPPAEAKPLSWSDATWGQRLTKPLAETVLGLPETWSEQETPDESEFKKVRIGAEKAVTGFASGLTTPLNLGLMIATGGLGSLAEGLGAEGLAAVAPELAPKVANAARVAAKLTNSAFTAEQIWNVSQKAVPEFYLAAKNGNTEQAAEALTSALLGGAAAAMSTAHLVGETEPNWRAEKETIGSYQNQVETHNIEAKNFAEQYMALIKNKPLDMAARLYHEAGGDMDTLEQWRSRIANNADIKPAVRDKFEGLLKLAQSLPDSVKALSARLRVDYGTDWQEAVAAQKKAPGTPGAENYAGPHTYQPTSEADSTVRPAAVRVTKNPSFMKERTFSNYVEALEKGYIPKDVGLAAARADYIQQFGLMKGAYAAEEAMLRQTADDGRPVAVAPGAVRQLGSKRVLYLGSERPDVYYHGTGPDFRGFGEQPASVTGNPTSQLGTFFSKLPEEAKRYVSDFHNGRGTVIKAQLDLKNPYEMSVKEFNEFSTPKDLANPNWQEMSQRVADLKARLQAEGYDGVKIAPGTKYEETVAFDPQQIKVLKAGSVAGPDLSKFDPADIIRKDGKVYLDTSDYVKAKPPFERFKFVTKDEEGEPVFQKYPVMIHPGYADKINNAFDTDSWFRKTPVMNWALKASTETKKTLLSLSPFHYTTEYLRGLQMGLDPVTAFSPPELTPDRLAVTEGTKYGLVLLGDNAARSMTAEGLAEHAGLLNRVPGLGPMLNKVEDHLFGDWIPRLKAETWERLVPQLERRHPEWTDAQRYELASKITNAAFGGLNWKQLGWSMGSTDFLRLIALAPDFTGSQLAFAKYGTQPGGSIVWQSFARIAAYNFAVAQMLNLWLNGKVHLEHPFSVQDPKDSSKLISIRTMPADIFHALTDPRSFGMNRLNPLTVRTAWEFGTGRDTRGQKVSGERQLIDLLRNVTPISLQNFVPAFRYPDEKPYQSGLRAVGLAVSQDVSPALQKARELSSDKAPGTAMDSSELAHYRFKLQVESALSNGTLRPAALSQLAAQGKLTRKEARQIGADVRETRGMDPLTAQLFLKVNRLSLPDALQVWDVSTDAERRTLLPLMRRKRITYRQNAYRNLTARERQKNAVFQRTQAENFRNPGYLASSK